MELEKYVLLVEQQFGKVKFPENLEELTSIKNELGELMESVNLTSYKVLQAMKIVECWGKDHGLLSGEDETDRKRN